VVDLRFIGELRQAQDADAASAAFGRYFDMTFAVDLVVLAMIALGSLILIGVMIRIERRSRARDQEIRAAALAPRPEPGSVAARPTISGTQAAPAAHIAPGMAAGSGPHLILTVGEGDQLIGEMEGQAEALSVDDLRAAAAALGRAGGTASIRIHGAGEAARSAATQASQILGSFGVPTTFAG
jgi:hypothetical protein